jgi:hypothetical protein
MDYQVDLSHFSEAAEPHGEGFFTVAVGGIAVRFEGLSDRLKAAALLRYAPFLSDADPLHVVRLVGGRMHYLDIAEDLFLRLEEKDFPGGRVLVSHVFAALWPSDGRPGMIRLSVDQDLQFSVGAIENYLRWCVADLALTRGGFVVHSAGLVRGGKAYLFFGHSGAGKSTATAISVEALGAQALSDDLVLVLKDGAGFVAATTPFWGTMSQEVKEKGLYPLVGLYHLNQASAVDLRPVPTALATGMILSCCPFVADPTRRAGRLMPLVEDLCRAVPAHELFFRKDPSFWDVVMVEKEDA